MDLAGLKTSKRIRWKNVEKLFAAAREAIGGNDVTQAELVLSKILVKEAEFCIVTQNIEAALPAEELEDAIEEHQEMSDSVLTVKFELNKFLHTPTPAATGVASTPHVRAKPTIKLPKLEIGKFEGSISDWLRFWGQFEVGIHNNTSLSTVDKFNYLRGLLTDSASLTIKGLQITDANYPVAIALLKDKYGKTDVLVSEHVRQLLNIKRVNKIDNGSELRKLFEEIMSHVASLKALGTDVTSMGALLCPVILQSIPRFLVIEWNRQNKGCPNTDLEKLLEFVKTELEGVEQASRMTKTQEESSTTSNKKPEFRTKRTQESTASSLVATSSKGAKSYLNKFGEVPYCLFCEKRAHYSTYCPFTKTLQARREVLKQNGRCTRCTKRNHDHKSCPNEVSCQICQAEHHPLFCTNPFRNVNSASKPQQVERSQSLTTTTSQGYRSRGQEEQPPTPTTSDCSDKRQIKVTSQDNATSALIASAASKPQAGKMSVLQTMRIGVRTSKGNIIQAVLLLDGGSERSFVVQRLVEKLGISDAKEERVNVHAFGSKQCTKATRKIPLSLVGNNEVEIVISALQVEDICSGVKLWENVEIEALLNIQGCKDDKWANAMGSGQLVSVDILIGADFYWAIMSGHSKRIAPLLMATQSVFGWVLQGSVGTQQSVSHAITMLSITQQETAIDNKLTQLWELDNQGIYARENMCKQTLQDVEVLQRFKDTTSFSNNRYAVRIPWSNNKEKLSNNFGLAKERLRKLINKLNKNQEHFKRYKEGIYEYLSNQHIEEVVEVQEPETVYYMPHHPIIKEDRKTTKLRIVFDASSHEFGKLSLNECQFNGPNLNPDIFDLLIRFRIHPVAVSSDMTKAFLQVLLQEQDRDATRFLWTDEPWPKQGEPKIKVFRMTRVLFGMKSSPFLLAATIRLHTSKNSDTYPEIGRILDESTYVDDTLAGQSTVEAAFDFSIQAEALMKSAGMILTKWVTNSNELRKLWVQQGFASKDEPIEIIKVLGLMWNPIEDVFSYKTAGLLKTAQDSSCTKRGILEVVASLFDPLGFLSPKTIIAKCLLQDIWRLKLGWDELIPRKLADEWEQWKNDLQNLAAIQVPRWYRITQEEFGRCQLHIFCDSSQRAYGVVAYLRIERQMGQADVCLIASKSRLAPLQLVSIPRLELMACLIGTRLGNNIRQAFHQPDLPLFFWTDSRVALQWIQQTPSKWKIFIARRVQEIQELKDKSQWNYCSTKDNISDIITRGRSLDHLLKNQTWWYGPKWLSERQEKWPSSEFQMKPSLEEEESIFAEENCNLVQVQVVTLDKFPLLDWTKFSRWNSLIRITAWIKRFVYNCRNDDKIKHLYLVFKELQDAESYWFAEMQRQDFPEEIWQLKKENVVDNKSPLLQFSPFLDEQGLIRVGGRLQFANLLEQKQHPLLLKGGRLTAMFIQNCHQKCLHGGVQATLIEIRKQVWVLKGRQEVRKALKNCMVCKRWNAKPAVVSEAPLPAARVNETYPFEVTGLDFAGPVFIKMSSQQVKAYICLFTCAVTRAVHLELVLDLTIKSFQLAFRRFIARRGNCKIIYSDNAATFQQASKLLQEAHKLVQNTDFQNQVAQQGVQWRFIAPRAAWWGGFYERLIGSIKRHLRRILGTALLTADELITILTEVEATVNSRPLITITEDFNDSEYLTPAHFLTGRASGTLADMLPGVLDAPIRSSLLRRWHYKKRLVNLFWKKWQDDYLLQLQSAHHVRSPDAVCALKQGDVVLIKEDKQPRGKWKFARIQELTEGRDKKIRSALLRTTQGKPIRRAVQHIFPLEII